MKTLILVRHAKSSWDNPQLNDFERPLNKRGFRDAPFMGNIMKEKGLKPDLIISSPALRAITTAKHFAEAVEYQMEQIDKNPHIYEYGPNGILRIIQKINDSVSTLMLFGHNPDITHLANYLSGEYFGNIPTCGVVAIDFNVDSWDDISSDKASLKFYEYPKLYFKK